MAMTEGKIEGLRIAVEVCNALIVGTIRSVA